MRTYILSDHQVICTMHKAMATIFELHIIHDDAQYCEQVSKAVFDEIDLLEQELSRFIENSDISRINNMKLGERIIISIHTFECLQLAKKMYNQTQGVFDISAGNLISSYKENDVSGQLQENSFSSGMDFIILNEEDYSVSLNTHTVNLDLGGIGKGFALDQVRQTLTDWGIHRALIQGGNSSVLMLDAPPGTDGWPLSISHSHRENKKVIEKISLKNISISSSGVAKGTHIIDPRSGRPADKYSGIWVKSRQAAESDVLSTTFMMYSMREINEYCALNTDTGCLIIKNDGTHLHTGHW